MTCTAPLNLGLGRFPQRSPRQGENLLHRASRSNNKGVDDRDGTGTLVFPGLFLSLRSSLKPLSLKPLSLKPCL